MFQDGEHEDSPRCRHMESYYTSGLLYYVYMLSWWTIYRPWAHLNQTSLVLSAADLFVALAAPV
jgi:hypothetical protein